MSEGHASKRIGRGMKPRGKKTVKAQKENKAMSEPSSMEGQPVPASEPVSEPETVVSTPGNLEPDSLQNLESKGADELEAALSQSAVESESKTGTVEPEEVAKPEPPCDGITMGNHDSGPQQDGTYVFHGVIPEGYLDPVTEMAKDRGISVEQWCNEFFFENLAAFFAPAGKR